MIPLVTKDEMRAMDEETIARHVPGINLMENAGKGVRDVIVNRWKRRKPKVVVICGKGNNGGDGFVIARLLKRAGYRVKVFLIGKKDDVKGDARKSLEKCLKSKQRITEVGPDNLDDLSREMENAEIVVDAIFGTGFEGIPRGVTRQVIEIINTCEGEVVAVDIPSGVNSTTGEAELAVFADITVTMALPKRGHILYPGRSYVGELIVTDIGIPLSVVESSAPKTFVIDPDDICEAIPYREPTAHKWTCGHVVAICGSTGFTGAATLTSLSALRSGCGLVTLAVPRSLNPIMEIKLTEVMTLPVEETPQGTFSIRAKAQLMQLVERASSVALGPGLSRNEETVNLLREILPEIGKPCVLDADGINAFAGEAHLLKDLGFPLVVTPHAGELSRLLGVTKDKIESDRIEFARKVATEFKFVLLLKGAPTVVATPEGRVYVNPTGNEGLATAGSGDVLTGIIAGLLAQGIEPDRAAYCGAFIHGLCGDILLDDTGYYGFIAGDLVDVIPYAISYILWGSTGE